MKDSTEVLLPRNWVEIIIKSSLVRFAGISKDEVDEVFTIYLGKLIKEGSIEELDGGKLLRITDKCIALNEESDSKDTSIDEFEAFAHSFLTACKDRN